MNAVILYSLDLIIIIFIANYNYRECNVRLSAGYGGLRKYVNNWMNVHRY